MTHHTDRVRTTVSRRELILGSAALGAGLTLPTLTLGQSKTMVFMTWGGAFGKGVREAFSDPFEKRTGIRIMDVTPFSYGKFLTAMKSGNPEGYDLLWFDDEIEPLLAGEQGLLEKLNYDWLPDAKHVIDSVKGPYSAAPYVTVYQGIYREDLYKTPPSSWRDFWDVQKFPGARSLGNCVGGLLEAALMADGVPPNKLYPLDEDRAFKSLDRLRSHIRVFHNTQQSEPVKQMLMQNEVSMVLTWSTDFIRANLAGEHVNVIYKEGFYFSPSVGIAKGTKLLREAHDYLNMFFNPDAELAFAKAWTTTPAAKNAYERMPEREKRAVAGGHLPEMVHLDPQYYAKRQAEIQKRYDAWRVGG